MRLERVRCATTIVTAGLSLLLVVGCDAEQEPVGTQKFEVVERTSADAPDEPTTTAAAGATPTTVKEAPATTDKDGFANIGGAVEAPPTTTGAYANCAAVRAAGKAPIRKGEPGFSSKLDADGDGIACE